MTIYYHSAPLLLEPGAIIHPGNWGRILNCYTQQQGNPWLLAREFVFESIRVSEYSDLPSRLSCAFAFETLDHANEYKSNFSPWNPLYEVELVDAAASVHRAGFNLVAFPPANTEFVPVVVGLARKYWRSEEIEVTEILTKSALRVRGLVSSGPGSYQP
ncbi:MAG: DUF2441 domain-containing protein [Propionivibrio sp.]